MKRNIGLRFVLTDNDDPDFCEPVGRVHELTIDELQRMVDVHAHIGEIPDGYSIEIQAVRRKRPEPTAEEFSELLANLNKSLDGLLAAVRT